ncbi:MAG: nucleotidyltransferase substrate binding protein [Anaerolineales bacterium]|nr:nucleotidyltransferase substrate binding protein [Anaerolineales bacterium]
MNQSAATNGSKDATRQAFKVGLIENGQTWMDMIQSRNLTSHTYDEATAAKFSIAVRSLYFPEFEMLHAKLVALIEEKEV